MEDKPRSPAYGFVLMGVSSLLFSAMTVLVKAASQVALSSYHVTLVRFVLGLLTMIVACSLGMANGWRIRNKKDLIIRGACGGIAVFAFFLTVDKLGMAKGTVLNYTYPAFAALFAWPMLRERVTLAAWVAVALSLAGVVMIGIRPENAAQNQVAHAWLYWGIGILGGLTGGIAVCAIKRCRVTENSYVIFGSQCLFGLFIVIPGMKFFPISGQRAEFPTDTYSWLLLLSIGSVAVLAQLIMTYSYKLVPVTEGSLLGLLTPAVNVGIGMLIFREEFPLLSLLGAVLVMCSCVLPTFAASSPGKESA